jgi:hypothetical protein
LYMFQTQQLSCKSNLAYTYFKNGSASHWLWTPCTHIQVQLVSFAR